MKNDVTIEGLDELQKTLEALAKKVDNDENTDIVYTAAERHVTPTVQSNAPTGPSGSLKDAVVTKRMPVSDSYPALALTAIDRKKAPHAHLVEDGSGPRYADGKYVGEMPPNPFFRTSVQQSLPTAYRFIEDELRKRVNS